MLGNRQKRRYTRHRSMRRERDYAGYAVAIARLASGAMLLSGLSLLCVLAYSVIVQCDYLNARQIDVTGNRSLSRDDVLAQAKVGTGTNIMAANLGVIRKRLLAHADIVSADVGRVFPDRLKIRIKEQQPLAVVYFENKYMMNTDGEIYKKYRYTQKDRFPVVTGLLFSDFEKGSGLNRKDQPYGAVMRILKLIRQNRHNRFCKAVKTIQVDRQMGITLKTIKPDCTVKLGFGDYEKKMDTLETVLAVMAKKYHQHTFCAVDMMRTDRVVLRPVMPDAFETDGEEV